MTGRHWVPATITVATVAAATGERSTAEFDGWTCQGLGLDERQSGTFVVTHLASGFALLIFPSTDLTAAMHNIGPLLDVSDWTFPGAFPVDAEDARRCQAAVDFLADELGGTGPAQRASLPETLRAMLEASLPGCPFMLMVKNPRVPEAARNLVVTTIANRESAIEFAEDMTDFIRENPAAAPALPPKAH